tara:strand:- start:350 stop:637 length:288 start_codon:yes stop_codon:yes gene_type:complete
MLCIACNNRTIVKDSRPYKKSIRRRRFCERCESSFSTVEQLARLTRGKTITKKATPAKAPQKTPPKKSDQDLIWDDLTDDELEIAIFEGRVSLDD